MIRIYEDYTGKTYELHINMKSIVLFILIEFVNEECFPESFTLHNKNYTFPLHPCFQLRFINYRNLSATCIFEVIVSAHLISIFARYGLAWHTTRVSQGFVLNLFRKYFHVLLT